MKRIDDDLHQRMDGRESEVIFETDDRSCVYVENWGNTCVGWIDGVAVLRALCLRNRGGGTKVIITCAKPQQRGSKRTVLDSTLLEHEAEIGITTQRSYQTA